MMVLHQSAGAPSMRFASPLQALTIWDNSEPTSPRDKYLQKFKAGLEAESKVREELQKKHDAFLSKQDTKSPEWAQKASRYERARKAREERLAEKAYDEAVKKVEAEQKKLEVAVEPSSNSFQFVGVVNKENSEKAISWYARKKPTNANWSLRLVHVNKDAIVKDLFNRRKVDVFSKYKNEGFKTTVAAVEGKSPEKKEIQIRAQYEVREKSWRTLWNFSPKHFFTDSSGMYWRERRLRPGSYTDGTNVFETTYRYKDGRNGIRKSRTLAQFMRDASVDKATKKKIMKKIQKDHPDIVLEGV